MKKLLLTLILAATTLAAHAQQPTMADVFRQMPDSLMPYLSANNRLDMVDFLEAGMKAEVTNLLSGTSEMTALTADSLAIRMSERLNVGMRLVMRDSLCVELTRTYRINESQEQVVQQCYSLSWLPVSDERILMSSLLRRDEEVGAKPQF